jgi:hypothetical protein
MLHVEDAHSQPFDLLLAINDVNNRPDVYGNGGVSEVEAGESLVHVVQHEVRLADDRSADLEAAAARRRALELVAAHHEIVARELPCRAVR